MALGIVDETPRARLRARLLAGLAPDLLRSERFFAGFFDHGASDDGGREEFDDRTPTAAPAPRLPPGDCATIA